MFLYFFQCFLQLFSVLASVSQAAARVLNNSMLLFRGTMLSFFQNVDLSLVFNCSLLQSVVAVAQLKLLALYALFSFRRPMLMLCRSMKSSMCDPLLGLFPLFFFVGIFFCVCLVFPCDHWQSNTVRQPEDRQRDPLGWREGMRILPFLFANQSNWPNGPK